MTIQSRTVERNAQKSPTTMQIYRKEMQALQKHANMQKKIPSERKMQSKYVES